MVKLGKKKLVLTTADLIVLSAIAEQPMHGYELNLSLERRDVQDWGGVSRPQIYYSLNKLKSLKMITETLSATPAEGPERQAYRISLKGKAALEKALDNEQWAIQRPPSPFSTWMALSGNASDDAKKRLIMHRREFLKKELAREKRTYDSYAHINSKPVKIGLLMVELIIKKFEVELEWLKKVERTLI